MKKHYMIPILLSDTKDQRDSIFYSGMENKEITAKDIEKTIDSYIKNLKGKQIERQLYFSGGCFSNLTKQKQQELLNEAYEQMEKKRIDSIAITTKTTNLDKDMLKMLKTYKVKTIELEVFSSNDYVLKKAGMKHSFEEIKQIARKIRWYGFDWGCKIMVGLPESTKLDELNTVKDMVKLRPKVVRICPVLVEKNTKLEKEYEKGNYEPISLVQAIERCKELIYLLNRKKIHNIHVEMPLIRQKETSSIIAGPFHTEFTQLVESNIWYDSIVDRIKQYNVKVRQVEVTVNPQDMNAVIGYEQENLKKLEDTYDVLLKVVMDQRIKLGKMEMKILQTYTDFRQEEEKIRK